MNLFLTILYADLFSFCDRGLRVAFSFTMAVCVQVRMLYKGNTSYSVVQREILRRRGDGDGAESGVSL